MSTANLRKDIRKKLDGWNERSMFTLKRVKNLSMADIHTLQVCCDFYDVYGSLEGLALYLSPEVKQVLTKYRLLERG